MGLFDTFRKTIFVKDNNELAWKYAQIDFIVITKAGTYFIECKNLFGNISVTSNGEFRRR